LPKRKDLICDLKKYISMRNSPVFLDFGANVGEFTTLLARSFAAATIFSFEPVSATYAKLFDRLTGGYLSSQVTAIKPAVGDHAGHAEIHLLTLSGCISLWSVINGSSDG
jgi:FkbM family methyltransferase